MLTKLTEINNVKYTREQRAKVSDLYSVERYPSYIRGDGRYMKGKYTLKQISGMTGVSLNMTHKIATGQR